MSDTKRLAGIDRLTSGQQAALKREAGKQLQDADAAALQAFFTALPTALPYEVHSYEHERYFAVLCLMCLWKPENRSAPTHFAECLRKISDTESAGGRFRALIDTDYNPEDGFLISKLARLVRQVRSGKIAQYPDFEQLLGDLLHWNDHSRWVQREWMEIYTHGLKTTKDNIN